MFVHIKVSGREKTWFLGGDIKAAEDLQSVCNNQNTVNTLKFQIYYSLKLPVKV